MRKMTFNRRTVLLSLLATVFLVSLILAIVRYPSRKKAIPIALPALSSSTSSGLSQNLADLSTLLMLQARMERLLSKDKVLARDSLEVRAISGELDRIQKNIKK